MVNFKLGEYTREMLFKSVTQVTLFFKKKIPITLGVQWHIVVVVFFLVMLSCT